MARRAISAASHVDFGRPPPAALTIQTLYADTGNGVAHLCEPDLCVCDQVRDGLHGEASRGRVGLKDEVHDRQVHGSARPNVT